MTVSKLTYYHYILIKLTFYNLGHKQIYEIVIKEVVTINKVQGFLD